VALIVAGITGVADILCYLRIDFPPMEAPEGGKPQGMLSSLRDVLRDSPFMRVVLCFTSWAFAINISAPFFNVHMLENLRMSYTHITLTNQIASNVATVLVVHRWGKQLDRFGNKAVLQICSRVCMFVPLLWTLLTPELVWLIAPFNVLSGVFMPIVDLSQQNFYLGASTGRNRAMHVAVFFAVFNLCGVALGNALGGLLLRSVFENMQNNMPLMQSIGWTKYHLIFLLSSLLRVAVVLGLFPMLHEENVTPYRAALSTISKEWYGGRVRRLMLARAAILRKRYRRKHPADAPPAQKHKYKRKKKK
jgi:MFS family permease